MKCVVCENEKYSFLSDNPPICVACGEKGMGKYIMKCWKCGAVGFAEKSPELKKKLEFFLSSPIDDSASSVLIIFNGCPDCAGKSGKA
ncbi:MAG: hypothetical protein AAB851_01535 [Patescibacteria group bacterium]